MRRFLQTWLGLGLLVAIASCEGSQLGASLQRTLEADPQLAEQDQTASEEGASNTGNNDASTAQESDEPIPEPGQEDFIGPIFSASATPNPTEETPNDTGNDSKPIADTGDYQDLDQTPEELRTYVEEMVALDILKIRNPSPESDSASTAQTRPVANEFKPNQPITRREFARWLLATNNRLYADQNAKKLRAAVGSSARVFTDVSAADPDFGPIQGLAEAGIIPSPLTGSSTVVTFRPDAPLTRKDLLLWKIPLDTRQALPNATVEAVQQSWGFQDAAKIQSPAIQAVLADHQLGEFANIRRVFGFTTLFQPDKGVTRAEAAATLWRFGTVSEGITAADVLKGEAVKAEEAEGAEEVTEEEI